VLTIDRRARHPPAECKRTTLKLTLQDAVSDKSVAQHFSQFGSILRMTQENGGRDRSVVFAREEHAAAAAAGEHAQRHPAAPTAMILSCCRLCARLGARAMAGSLTR
jgi:hypothetical protein